MGRPRRRLNASKQQMPVLIGNAEMIGVEDGDGWILYAPLEA